MIVQKCSYLNEFDFILISSLDNSDVFFRETEAFQVQQETRCALKLHKTLMHILIRELWVTLCLFVSVFVCMLGR